MTALSLQPNFRAVVPIVAGIGNAMMALPIVRQLKTRARAGHITVLARLDAMGEPFRRVSEVDEVIVTGSGVRSLLRGAGAARRRGFDLMVIPFPSNRWQYAAFALAAGARHTLLHSYPIGYVRSMQFIGTRVPAVRGIHDVEQNLRLLRSLGVEPDLSEAPRFELHEHDRQRARESTGENPFVAIHAGSARTILARAKRWPAEKYAELIGAIRREGASDVVLLEGPDEVGVSDEIVSRMGSSDAKPRVLTLAGNLGHAAAVLERAALYVGSDSGLAHLAAAVGTPPVTIFAPADPDRVCPFGYRDLVVKPDKPCSPCFLYPWQATHPKMRCGEGGRAMCIAEVTGEQVMAKVRQAMRTGRTLSLRERVG